MTYKFEKLQVWQMALEYTDMIYDISAQLPSEEQYNLKSQIERAVTAISLNIAEGSTSQSDKEQRRFLGYAIRSLLETVACQHLIHRRRYLQDRRLLRESYRFSQHLFARLQALRKSLTGDRLGEEPERYVVSDETPFD